MTPLSNPDIVENAKHNNTKTEQFPNRRPVFYYVVSLTQLFLFRPVGVCSNTRCPEVSIILAIKVNGGCKSRILSMREESVSGFVLTCQ